MKIVTFVDYGVAWSENEDLAWKNSKTGYGFGLHLLVPEIDRIRLDVGFSEDGDVKFHIAIRSIYDAQRQAAR
jgi:outer membrane translocation and assembly module TamA